MIILVTVKYNSNVQNILEEYNNEDIDICGIQYYNYNFNHNYNIIVDDILNPKTNIDLYIQNEIKDKLESDFNLFEDVHIIDTFGNGLIDTPENILSMLNDVEESNLIVVEENDNSPYIGSSTSWIIFGVTILVVSILLFLTMTVVQSYYIRLLFIIGAIIITILGIVLASIYDDTDDTITVIVGGGLSNRIRPIVSSTILGMVTDRPVKIYSLDHAHMVYDWNEIFESSNYINVNQITWFKLLFKLNVSTIKDIKYCKDLIDETNLPTSVIREIDLNEKDIPKLILSPHNYRHKNISEKAYIKLKKILLRKLKFNDDLQSYINEYLKEINENVYGVHIRGGDFYHLYSEEPSLSLWTDEMDKIIKKNRKAKFFVASDSDRRNQIREKYKNRLISINYDYIEDMKNITDEKLKNDENVKLTFAEFISLANCREIIGTSGSTFSDETYFWPSLNINTDNNKSIIYVKPKYKEDSRYAKF